MFHFFDIESRSGYYRTARDIYIAKPIFVNQFSDLSVHSTFSLCRFSK